MVFFLNAYWLFDAFNQMHLRQSSCRHIITKYRSQIQNIAEENIQLN